MINTDPPEHTRRRRLVSSGFTPKRVAAHEAFLRATVGDLIDAVVDRGGCDFVEDVAKSVPLRMIAATFATKLIPAGTGMTQYRNIRTDAAEYEPMEYYTSGDDDADLAEWLAGRRANAEGADVIAYPSGT